MRHDSRQPFWKRKIPDEFTRNEWESLCDGCAKCCLQKIEDTLTGTLYYTRIVCRYLDLSSCRCTCYDHRCERVPSCLQLTPRTIYTLSFLPPTCAYRLIAEGKDLPHWHPLVSGDPALVHDSGNSVRGKVLSEEYVHPEGWDEHIIDWVDH